MAIARRAKMGAHLLSFVIFERTGMRLLLRNADFFQHIEDRLTFDFQFSGQVVDSNLTHPPFVSSRPSR